MMELDRDEVRIIRKALQLMKRAHDVVETADGTDDKETAVDRLIRKIRAEEERDDH